MHAKASVLVVGASDALGGAIARGFAREGYTVAVARRTADKLTPLVEAITSAGGTAKAYPVNARKEDQMIALFEQVKAECGALEAFIFNIGANIRFSITVMTAQKYMKTSEMACFLGFLTGSEAARRMVPRGRGSILFTGATASLRGGAGVSAFSGAKAALRMLAQSMARELGPKGVHVAHVVVDGAIDTAWIRQNFPDRYAMKDAGGILDPDHIADNCWNLDMQTRHAWTHELGLRPWTESF